MFSADHISLFEIVEQVADRLSLSAFVVGGVIRDLFCGFNPGDKDIDFIIEGDAQAFAEQCVPLLEGSLKTFDTFGTAKVVSPRRFPSLDEVDFASSREETYEKPGALPNVRRATIEHDLKRRDFTINTLAVEVSALREWSTVHLGDLEWLRSNTLDSFGGLADLSRGLVRVLHEKSFVDDPTRLFRGCRYCVRIGGSFEVETERLAQEAVKNGALATISPGRMANELRKVCEEARIGPIFEKLVHLGILTEIFPLTIDKQQLVTVRIAKLDQLGRSISGVLKYQIVLRILIDLVDREGREDLLSEFGLGKKEIKRFFRERNQIQKVSDRSVCAGLKSETLVFMHLFEPPLFPAAMRELASRGIVL